MSLPRITNQTIAPVAVAAAKTFSAQPQSAAPNSGPVDYHQVRGSSLYAVMCAHHKTSAEHKNGIQEAATRRVDALRSFRNRALATLPWTAVAFELNQLSQAGIAPAMAANCLTLILATTAAVSACASAVALKKAAQAKQEKADLKLRLKELQGAMAEVSLVTLRHFHGVDKLSSVPQASPAISSGSAAQPGAMALASPSQPRKLQPMSTVITPPPGWQLPRKSRTQPQRAPMSMDADPHSGTTYLRPNQ